MPRTERYPFRADLRARLIEIASQGATISYLSLGAGRAMIGRYLLRIACEEATAGRPPLTAVVVRRDTKRPGEGFRDAMLQIGYMAPTSQEDERTVWQRALRDVHEYWRPKLGDDLNPY